MIETISSVTVYKDIDGGASSGSVAIVRKGDGSFEFTDKDGHRVRAQANEDVRKLFEVIEAISS